MTVKEKKLRKIKTMAEVVRVSFGYIILIFPDVQLVPLQYKDRV